MQIESLNLDYYSRFLGEKEIRLYTYPKGVDFKIIERYPDYYQEIPLEQGKNGIYYFSFWGGYYSYLKNELWEKTEYYNLPQFIKNWNECKGWGGIEYEADVITNDELDWLLKNISEIIEQLKQNPQKDLQDVFDFFADLIKFLTVVKDNDWELRIYDAT